MVAGVLPDRTIGTTRQTVVADVSAAWIQNCELSDEPRREILVSKSSICCSAGGYTHHPTLALGGKRQTSADIVLRQLREIGQDLLLAHTGSKVREHVTDGNAGSLYARLPEPNFKVHDDSISVIHGSHNR
jgi:hypothetical protein